MRRKGLKLACTFALAFVLAGNSVCAAELAEPNVVVIEEEAIETTEETMQDETVEATEGVLQDETEEASEEIVEDEVVETTEETASEEVVETTEETASEEVVEATEETTSEEAAETIEETVAEETEVIEETVTEETVEATEESTPDETVEPSEEASVEENVTEEEEFVEVCDEVTGEKFRAVIYKTEDGFQFYVSGRNAIISGYTGTSKALKIPTTVKYGSSIYNVGGIKDEAFVNRGDLTSLVIPGTVSYIGESAFLGCKSLKSISLGEGITEIRTQAFSGCVAVEQITIPGSVQKIGDYAFSNCENMSSVVINPGVESIGANAFDYCSNLRIVDVPGSVKNIQIYSFANCANLTNVSLQDGVTTIDYRAFYGDSKLQSIYIPATVVSIGSEAFASTGLANGGTVYCKKGSVADTVLSGIEGVKIVYDKPAVTPPTFTVKGYVGGRKVTFSCAEKDAVIYYSTTTSKLTTADKWVANGGTIPFEGFYGNIYAKAYYNGQWSNVSRLIVKVPTVSAPTITYHDERVTLRTRTPNAMIYYTTDGTEPSPTNGKRFFGSAGSFLYVKGQVKAIAVRSGFANSSVVTKNVAPVISKDIAAPNFKVKGVINGRTVTFQSKTPGTQIYYSTSSSLITKKDKKVENGESVTFSNYYGTVYARTYKDGVWSNVSKLILKIPVVTTPTIRRVYEGIEKTNFMILETETPDCIIYYTTDGTNPSPKNGTRVDASSVQIKLEPEWKVIKMIAVRSCFTNSKIVSYTIQ